MRPQACEEEQERLDFISERVCGEQNWDEGKGSERRGQQLHKRFVYDKIYDMGEVQSQNRRVGSVNLYHPP